MSKEKQLAIAPEENFLRTMFNSPNKAKGTVLPPEKRAYLREKVCEILTRLPSKERAILRLHFGLEGESAQKLEEISSRLNLPPTKIREIEARTIRGLQHSQINREKLHKVALEGGLAYLAKEAESAITNVALTQSQNLLVRSIFELGLSKRTRKICCEAGIRIIDDLRKKTADELLALPDFGPPCLYEVREKLRHLNLKLQGD